MKRTAQGFVFAVAALAAGTTYAQNNPPAAGGSSPAYPSSSFLVSVRSTWESVRDLVVNMADSIPEDKYDWKPTPEVRSFREQLTHLAGENYLFFGRVSGENATPAGLNDLKTKEEIMAALRESYAYGERVFDSLTEASAMEMVAGRGRGPGSQRWSAILGVIQDNMDHYGNLVVYVRLNGMVPPRSAGRAGGGRGRGGM